MLMLRITLGVWVMAILVTGGRYSAYAQEEERGEQEVYVPKDLDDCFAQLKQILKPEEIEQMKQGTEGDMGKYHFGLGMWIRNNWCRGKQGRMAKWFYEKGIHHRDDMSGIILRSFWRHLNSQPIELDEQIKHYQDYWKQVRTEGIVETVRAKRAVVEIRGMMMGVSPATTSAPSVTIPNRESEGLRARYLARLGNNVLIAVRTGEVENFTTPGYCLNLAKKKIHPIRIPEIEDQQYAVVSGDIAYFSGVTKGVPVLVAVSDKTRAMITLPDADYAPQLGIDGERLLAVYRTSIYRLQGTTWSEIYKGETDLPKSGPPPRRFGDRIFFRDEGKGEGEKRLWWLDLTKQQLVSLDEDIGVVGRSGPRWENSYSYDVTPEGDLWATVGSTVSGESLVKQSPSGRYEIAIINNSLQFNGELLDHGSDGELPISAVAMGAKGILLLAGNRGLYTLEDKRLQPIVAFENVAGNGASGPNLPWSGCPGNVLQLDDNRYLISGVFGGIYLIERLSSREGTATSLDETIGEPVTF